MKIIDLKKVCSLMYNKNKRKTTKEESEFEFYNKFYEELIDDPKKPWCGYYCRRMIKEELIVACPNLDEEATGKVVLDLGSGCTGVLRLFQTASLKIEMDPLIDKYIQAEIMTISETSNTILLKGYSENIPLSDEFVDVIVSRNALDHVENLKKTSDEINRVLKPSGLLIIVVDLNQEKSDCEPSPICDIKILHDLFINFMVEYEDIKDIPNYEKYLDRENIKRPTYYGRLRKKDTQFKII